MMNVIAIYGIYQLFARVYGFPFGDLIQFKAIWLKRFNWSNQIYILGMHIYRSNAVFREPSFSQYLAINILIYFSKY